MVVPCAAREVRGGEEGGAFKGKTEDGVGVEVVEGRPGAVPVVGEFGMGAISRDAKFFPFRDVGL